MKYPVKRANFSIFVLHNLTLLDELGEEKAITSSLKRRRRQVCNVNRFIRQLHKYCFVTRKKLDQTDVHRSRDQQSAKAVGETRMKGRTYFLRYSLLNNRNEKKDGANESKVELMISPCSYGNTDRSETTRFSAFYNAHGLHICSRHFEVSRRMIFQ